MEFERKFVLAAVVFMLLLTAACNLNKKKVPPTIPAHAEAPTLHQPLPDRIPEQRAELPPFEVAHEEPAPPPLPAPPKKRRPAKKTTPTANAAAEQNNSSGSSSSGNTSSTGNTASASNNSSNAATTTVAANRPPEEPAPNTAIATDVAPAQATHDNQSTAQLLDSAEKTIKGLDDHSLSEDQKAMVSQIWSYIAQSRKATIDGDLERALNLATKAHLLSEALVKK